MSKAKISVVVPIDPRRPTEILASINSQKDKCIPIFVASPPDCSVFPFHEI